MRPNWNTTKFNLHPIWNTLKGLFEFLKTSIQTFQLRVFTHQYNETRQFGHFEHTVSIKNETPKFFCLTKSKNVLFSAVFGKINKYKVEILL